MNNAKQNVFDTLMERGLIAQSSNMEKVKEMLGQEKITFYIGFDGTADSLHIGHFMPIILMMHMQRAGHRPIALMGTGTTMVGDPTGKTDMRKMLSTEEIDKNAENFHRQIAKHVDFEDNKAVLEKNGDWLRNLNYMDFLRDIGVHFSVNRMLSAECFKSRMETGLSFLEFNYMIMQSYDFLHLYEKHGCILQMGGDDQWSNMLGGVDLIRRVHGKEAYCFTTPLLTTKEGKKMGKTESGALWLDPDKVSPYEFFQYWRNVDDADVIKTLKFMTFIPIEEIDEMAKLEGSDINKAKERLAYEVTSMIHGKDEADKALQASQALFVSGKDDSNMPITNLSETDFVDGKIDVLSLLVACGLAGTKSEARRLVTQGGISLDGEKVEDVKTVLDSSNFADKGITIKKGKKVYHKAILAR